jgi:Rps23 Pro-64 3,4-dihydroxylase Tpa1-like proline 4-hydroxylase
MDNILTTHINPKILEKQNLDQVASSFKEQTLMQSNKGLEIQSISKKPRQFIQLKEILIPKQRAILMQELEKVSWEKINEPHKESLSTSQIQKNSHSEFLESKDFQDFIEKITSTKIDENISWQFQKFQKNDFTLLHDDNLNENTNNQDTLLIIFDLTRKWPIEARGEIVITTANNTNQKNNNSTPLIIRPIENTLSIIKLKKDDMYFTKFINSSAQNKEIIRIVGIANIK